MEGRVMPVRPPGARTIVLVHAQVSGDVATVKKKKGRA